MDSPSIRGRGKLMSPYSNILMKYGKWFIGGLGLFTYGLYTNITSGLIPNDGSWFLWVVDRMVTGDIIYRDMYFPVTPLPAYVGAAFASLVGTELIVVGVIEALSYAITGLLALLIARQLDSGRTFSILLVMALLAYVPSWVPGAGAPYTPMAYTLHLGCLTAILSWRNRSSSSANDSGKTAIALVIAGAWAGLVFASKPSIGLYTLAAAMLAIAIINRQKQVKVSGMRRDLLTFLAGFISVVIAFLVPIWQSGALDRFLDDVFISKEIYVRIAGISYQAQLQVLWNLLRNKSLSMDLYWQLQFLLPFLTFGALAWAWLRSRPIARGLASVIIIFTAAAFADVFPRVSIHHTSATLPMLLLSLGWAVRQIQFIINARWTFAIQTAFALWLTIGMAYLLINPLLWISAGTYQFSSLPHLRGALVPVNFLKSVADQAKTLALISDGKPLFILNPSAGLYYLASGVRNPTRYDYPLALSFGSYGEAEVIQAIEQKQLRSLCMTPLGSYYLKPALLENYVLQNMEPSQNAGFCTVYRTSQ